MQLDITILKKNKACKVTSNGITINKVKRIFFFLSNSVFSILLTRENLSFQKVLYGLTLHVIKLDIFQYQDFFPFFFERELFSALL